MDSNDIVVSVYCLAYNHERFIKDTLDGFVNQKARFKYEVFVHDDASTDNTAAIIREYAVRYPEIIKPIFQQENQHSKKIRIVQTYMLPKMSGKYVACCEGDDYWTDPHKLQKQVDILEEYPNCTICFGVVESVNINGGSLNKSHPEKGRLTEGIIKQKDFLRHVAYPAPLRNMFIQLSGCMWRMDVYKEYLCNPPFFRSQFDVGDIPIFLYLGLQGDAYFIDRAVSCYRTMNAGSFMGRTRQNREKFLKHLETESEGLRMFDQYSNGIVHEAVEQSIKSRRFQGMQYCHDIVGMKSSEMAEFYHMLDWKVKIKENLFHFFPWLEPLMKKTKSILIK